MSVLSCSGFFFIHNYLKDIYSMSHLYFCLPWLLESCIPVIFYMYSPLPLFLLKYYCAVIQYHTNCNNSYLCDLQQKNDVTVNLLNGPTIYSYSREWKYSTNVNCHCQSKTEERKGCNYYLPDLKSDCNHGGKYIF